MSVAARLGLGGAQFGLDYGISNNAGKVPPGEIRAILDVAAAAGIRLIDTAPAYGDSESAIGAALAGLDDLAIVSKTGIFPVAGIDTADIARFDEIFAETLKRLGRRSIHALLVHHGNTLLRPGGQKLWDAMLSLRNRKLVRKIGVSVYDPAELEAILRIAQPDVVQLPASLVDQRFVRGGHVAALRRTGIETHGRSLFLQGLLLLPEDRLPGRFAGLRPHWRDMQRNLQASELSRLQACLACALAPEAPDRAIVGVANADELQQIVAAAESVQGRTLDVSAFALEDPGFINPANWAKLAS